MTTTKAEIHKVSVKNEYKKTLRKLQIELVKLQREIIKSQSRILVVFEGRDAAGKDGTIKRITKHLSPREVRIVALGNPSDHDQKAWYFQRFGFTRGDADVRQFLGGAARVLEAGTGTGVDTSKRTDTL
jgi:polyphosphate kinase 2 (PPK2 family)